MLAIAILAAGKGTRMQSTLPKVLQELSGITLIERVINDSKIHVIRHLDGICHTYIEKSSDPDLSEKVTVNAKMRRPGI